MTVDSHAEQSVGLAAVERVVTEIYVPLTEVERAVVWPNAQRFENDSEHSYSLALTSAALAESVGLDPAKCALYSTFHDAKERWAHDTPFFDAELGKTKATREEEGLNHIYVDFPEMPIIATTVLAYEIQDDEEACFVNALDKLLATYMIFIEGGSAWKNAGFTHAIYRQKVVALREKIKIHPDVLRWFDELVARIDQDKDRLFLPETQEVIGPENYES